jgi:hypothetical protein
MGSRRRRSGAPGGGRAGACGAGRSGPSRGAADAGPAGRSRSELCGVERRHLHVSTVAIEEATLADLVVREGLEPPVEDRQIGGACLGVQADLRLPERVSYLPLAPVRADDASRHVHGAVNDHLRDQRGAPVLVRGEPLRADLLREEDAEPVDGGVGEVEDEIGRGERVRRELGEDLRDALELGHDRRVLRGVRVLGARLREVALRLGRVERQEVPFEEGFGGEHSGPVLRPGRWLRAPYEVGDAGAVRRRAPPPSPPPYTLRTSSCACWTREDAEHFSVFGDGAPCDLDAAPWSSRSRRSPGR